MRNLFLASPLFLLASGEALACTYPLLDPIEGETDQQYSARNNAWIEARAARLSREWQAARFDRAARVSLARVTTSSGFLEREATESGLSEGPLFKSTVVPVAALKGDLRTASVALRYRPVAKCAVFEEGTGAQAPVGAMVVLFEEDGPGGVAKAEGIRLDMVNDARVTKALAELSPALREPGQ